MKNIAKKIVVILLVISVVSKPAHAEGTYVERGAWIGAVSGGLFGLLPGGTNMQSNCDFYCAQAVVLDVLAGMGIGTIIGVSVGALIPKANPIGPSSSNRRYAHGSYIGRGAWVGAFGGLSVGIAAAFIQRAAVYCSDDCQLKYVAYPMAGAAIGSLTGLLIGAAIPKSNKITIAPILSMSPTHGTTAGGTVQIRF